MMTMPVRRPELPMFSSMETAWARGGWRGGSGAPPAISGSSFRFLAAVRSCRLRLIRRGFRTDRLRRVFRGELALALFFLLALLLQIPLAPLELVVWFGHDLTPRWLRGIFARWTQPALRPNAPKIAGRKPLRAARSACCWPDPGACKRGSAGWARCAWGWYWAWAMRSASSGRPGSRRCFRPPFGLA